jgi:hypothetical protein
MIAWTDHTVQDDFILAYPDAVVPDPNVYIASNRTFGEDQCDRPSMDLFFKLLGHQELRWKGRYAAQVWPGRFFQKSHILLIGLSYYTSVFCT